MGWHEEEAKAIKAAPLKVIVQFPLVPFNGGLIGRCWTRIDGEQVDGPGQFIEYTRVDEREQLRAENTRLRKLVEFYADPKNTRYCSSISGPSWSDFSEKARAFIEKVGG